MKNLSLQNKIVISIAVSLAFATTILGFMFVHNYRKDVMNELFYKAKAIGRMAENARNATGALVGQKAFRSEELLKEAQVRLKGVTPRTPEFFSTLRQTTYYNTIPVVSAFNAALKGSEESHFQFKPTRFSARNPEYEPVTPVEKQLL